MLELTILSSLLFGSCHGYEIKKILKGMKVNNNTLYPLLKKLNENGYVSMQLIEQDNKPAKKVYSITEKGRDRLFDLVRNFTIEDSASDDAFYLRLAFFQFLPKEAIADILKARLDYLEEHERKEKVMYVLQRFPDNSYDLLYLKNFANSKIFSEKQLVKTLREKYGIEE